MTDNNKQAAMVRELLERAANYADMNTADDFSEHILRNYSTEQRNALGENSVEQAYNLLRSRSDAPKALRLSPFGRRAEQIERRLGKVRAALEEVQTHILRGSVDAAYEAAFELANQTEMLTLMARELPVYSGRPEARKAIDVAMISSVPIDVGFTMEGWFCVKLPALLPKKQSGSPDWLGDALYAAMPRFWSGKTPVCYRDCVLIYCHIYDRERPERSRRDHDNIELNRVTDIIALYVMDDDSPLKCRHYYCSAEGNADKTEVYVVPRDEFAAWLNMEELLGSEGVKLYENLPKNI